MRKLALCIAPFASLLIPVVAAAPAAVTTRAAKPHCSRAVGIARNGQTITMVKGTCARLQLTPSSLNWSLPASSGGAVRVLARGSFTPDATAALRAVHTGRATITSIGRPNCAAGRMCPQYLVSFSLHVRVVAPRTAKAPG